VVRALRLALDSVTVQIGANSQRGAGVERIDDQK